LGICLEILIPPPTPAGTESGRFKAL
jgi:hypothetical protein